MAQPLFGSVANDVVRVALPVPVDELFDYAVPDELAGSIHPGCRVQVRLGARHLTGVVVERGEGGQERALRPIDKLVDPRPALSPAMLSILREAAADAPCPLGIALATALPAGSAPRFGGGYALTPRGREALAAGAVRGPARALLDALAARARGAGWLRRRGGETAPAVLRELEKDGLVARGTVETAPAARPRTERVVSPTPDRAIDDALAELARAPQQAALLREIAERGGAPLRALRELFPTAPALVRQLAARGLVRVEDRAAPRDVLGAPLEADAPVALTPEQEGALGPVVEALRAARFEAFLLHGVTGSGKTEVYLRAVGAALAAGRQALVLVPEITLTHQILARLRGRFGDNLAVLHSGLSAGERLEQWERLRGGRVPLAVGARSALFAPLENLGVIVVDEEHDTAYKNDEGFRYHARDLALRRARTARCPLVLGSATPSLESRYAADRGELRLLSLPRRVAGRPLPAVQIVDLARERETLPRGRKLILSRPLSRAIAETLADGGQTILLLNRRGFSTQILCFQCGHAWRCLHCDVALVFHASDSRLRCHYCDYSVAPPEACPACGAPDSALLGLGTERLEEEVRTRFPDARVTRLDRDTAARRGFTAQVLRDLRDGHIDILIGTQLVAKGHDFPDVRLVGVVLADVGLHLPDFRAAERTFQLLTQVAGRAGRDRAPGRVIVQTFSPDHYAIRPVRDHDYESFYTEELSHRKDAGFPPFGQLVRAVVSARDDFAARDGAERLAGRARAIPGAHVLGPAPAPLARLRGRHRVALLVRSADASVHRRAAAALAREAAALPDAVQASVDASPVNML